MRVTVYHLYNVISLVRRPVSTTYYFNSTLGVYQESDLSPVQFVIWVDTTTADSLKRFAVPTREYPEDWETGKWTQ